MNILYIGAFRLPNYDAGAPRVLNNAKVFRELGHNVSFISWGGMYGDSDLCSDGIYRVNDFKYIITDELPMRNTSLQERLLLKLNRGRKTIKILKEMECKPDLIIMYNADYNFTKKVYKLCSLYNIKLANDINEWFANNELHCIDVIKNHINMTIIQKKIRNKIVISTYLDKYYEKSNNLLVPPLCDRTDEKWDKIVEDKRIKESFEGLTFIYAGNPGKKDSIYTIVEAFNILAKNGENVRIIILGITLEKYINDYYKVNTDDKLHKNIIFLGKVSQDLVPAYYKKADFMVLFRETTRKSMAGFPTKIAESITSGIPVITNSTSDIDKYIKNGVNGFVLDTYDANSLIFFLQDVILKLGAEKLQEMKESTVKTSEYFDWHSYKESFRYFINNLR
jgi:glycosyltransferase involved in cell wall biosynthesis